MWLLWGAPMMVTLLTRSSAVPVLGDTNKTGVYVSPCNYLNRSVLEPSVDRINETSRSDATSEVQSFVGLNESNEGTDNFMRKPVNDSVIFEMEDYTLFDSRHKFIWESKDLTYRIAKYSTKLSHKEVDREIARAFSLWSKYTDFTFTQKTYGPFNINISFEIGAHGDDSPFDGNDKSLAHAAPYKLFPGARGFRRNIMFKAESAYIHFDDSKTWTTNSVRRGFNLFPVAIHEIGHVLGLGDSKDMSTVMSGEYSTVFDLSQDDISGIEVYVFHCNYLNRSVLEPSVDRINETSRSDATSEVQSFVGLNESNELNEDTDNFLRKPVNDSFIFETEDYTLYGPRMKWDVKNLTYSITKYSTKLSHEEVDREIARAFSLWSKYTDFTFTQKTFGPVNINIRFEKGSHGDKWPFDGRGINLAHAINSYIKTWKKIEDKKPLLENWYQIMAADVHFDDSETWTTNSVKGINLLETATHEFGHVLGLGHSRHKSSVMWKYNRGYDTDLDLSQDDISGIEILT